MAGAASRVISALQSPGARASGCRVATWQGDYGGDGEVTFLWFLVHERAGRPRTSRTRSVDRAGPAGGHGEWQHCAGHVCVTGHCEVV